MVRFGQTQVAVVAVIRSCQEVYCLFENAQIHPEVVLSDNRSMPSHAPTVEDCKGSVHAQGNRDVSIENAHSENKAHMVPVTARMRALARAHARHAHVRTGMRAHICTCISGVRAHVHTDTLTHTYAILFAHVCR